MDSLRERSGAVRKPNLPGLGYLAGCVFLKFTPMGRFYSVPIGVNLGILQAPEGNEPTEVIPSRIYTANMGNLAVMSLYPFLQGSYSNNG